MLGSAGRVVVTKDTTTVTHGSGAQSEIDARVAQLRREIEDTDSDWDREKLQERLAKLAGGVGVIQVGAATEVELKERKHRIEDAIAATRAAVEEGIVAGGGAALLHATGGAGRRPRLLRRRGDGCRPSFATALAEPLRWIADNAGLEGYVVTSRVAALPATYGLERGDRRVRRPAQGRRRRPGEGHQGGAGQRGAASPACCSPRRARSSRSRPSRRTTTVTTMAVTGTRTAPEATSTDALRILYRRTSGLAVMTPRGR